MLCREGATHPKMMSVGLHMRMIGHPARAAGIARHWIATPPARA